MKEERLVVRLVVRSEIRWVSDGDPAGTHELA